MTLFNPIRLEIPTVAVAKARAKRNAYGAAYIPKKTKSFEAELRWHWQASKNEMIPRAPTDVEIVCYLPRPKSVKETVLFPIVRPDVDNLTKSIFDAFNGFAWKDDAQICRSSITKWYVRNGETPRICIVISPLVAA